MGTRSNPRVSGTCWNKTPRLRTRRSKDTSSTRLGHRCCHCKRALGYYMLCRSTVAPTHRTHRLVPWWAVQRSAPAVPRASASPSHVFPCATLRMPATTNPRHGTTARKVSGCSESYGIAMASVLVVMVAVKVAHTLNGNRPVRGWLLSAIPCRSRRRSTAQRRTHRRAPHGSHPAHSRRHRSGTSSGNRQPPRSTCLT
jgi:hypothetical protein